MSLVLATFEAVAVVSVVAVGIWFVVAGWGEFSNGLAIAAFVVIGLAGAMLTLPLSRSGRHWLAAVTAGIAIVTPTGFAYLPNLMMVAVAAIEVWRAIKARSVDG